MSADPLAALIFAAIVVSLLLPVSWCLILLGPALMLATFGDHHVN